LSEHISTTLAPSTPPALSPLTGRIDRKLYPDTLELVADAWAKRLGKQMTSGISRETHHAG
jgi:hypothetical protein